MSKDRGDPTSSDNSNADVEKCFDEKKNTVHDITHNKVGRYVRIERRHVANVVKKIGAGIVTSSKTFKKMAEKREVLKAIRSKVKSTSCYTKGDIGKTLNSKIPKQLSDDSSSIRRHEETWGFSPAKKHSYFHKDKVTLLSEGKEIPVRKTKKKLNDQTPSKKTGLSERTPASTMQTLKKQKDTGEEEWHSPPTSKKESIKKVMVARSLSLSKQQSKKTLQLNVSKQLKEAPKDNRRPYKRKLREEDEKFDNAKKDTKENNDEVFEPESKVRRLSLDAWQSRKTLRVTASETRNDLIFVSEKLPSLEEIIRQSHYRHHCPSYDFSSKLVYLPYLNEEEKLVVHMQEENGINGVFLGLERDEPLYFFSFLQLLQKCPLSSDVVDACLYDVNARFGNASTYVASYTEGHLLTAEPSSEFPEAIRSIIKYDKLLIPIKKPQHWSLACVNLRKMEFQLLDPAGRDQEDELIVLRRLEVGLSKIRKQKPLHIAKRILSFPTQQNDYDCAILLIYFVEAILRSGKCPQINTEDYRIELAKRLLEMSRTKLNESISMQRERKSLKCDTYENGLICSCVYYSPVLPVELSNKGYIVCVYGQEFSKIDGESFRNLVHHKWLTNDVIDAAIFSFMKAADKKEVVNVLCHHAREIFTKKIGDNHILNYVSINDKTLVMPVNLTGFHWCIAIANVKEKQYQFFDPYDLKTTNKNLDKFLDYLKRRNKMCAERVEINNWTTPEARPDYPTQRPSDLNNCGVFVVLYALLHLNSISISEFRAPESFREKIAENILQKCPNMRHLCLVCGHDEFMTNETSFVGGMIQCNSCYRWLHLKCLKKVSCSLTQDMSREDFTCFLCDQFQSVTTGYTVT